MNLFKEKPFSEIQKEIHSTIGSIRNNLEKDNNFFYSQRLYKDKKTINVFLDKYKKDLDSHFLNIASITDNKESNDDNLYLQVNFKYGEFTQKFYPEISEGFQLPVLFVYSAKNESTLKTRITIKALEKTLLESRKYNANH